jgi:hypothetical protein
MALVTITRKAETLQSYKLVTPNDMVTALAYLSPTGYTGHIALNDHGVWQLAFQNAAMNINQTALIDDYIIVTNGLIATSCPNASYSTLYQ